MRARHLLAGSFVAVALLGLCSSTAAAATAPSAPALLARATQVRDELALLGQGSSPLGLPGSRPLSEFKFINRDGYTITVVAFGQTVALSVTRKHGHRPGPSANRSSTTTYLAHGKVTPTSVQASFADRGRIALRFRPSGRELHASRHAGCVKPSDSVIGRLGLFVGELRFRGENGYTSAEVHRVHGGSIDFAALVACLLGSRPGQHALLPSPRPPLQLPAIGTAAHLHGAGPSTPGVRTHPSHRPKRTMLVADRKLPLARTVFGAQLRGEGRARFVAIDESSDGPIGIIRIAAATGPKAAFSFDDPLGSAAVTPPPPFSGNGAFQHGPGDERSWSGSLAVSFFGAPRVPLTGSPFRAQLVQSW